VVRYIDALPDLEAEEIRMNRPIARACAAAALAALTLTSCSNNNTATSPTPNPTTETFTGTLVPGQRAIHPYAVTTPGSVTTTLTALTGATTIGVASGTWDGAVCTIGAHSENVTVGNYFVANVPSAQNLCAMVYDTGGIVTTASYTLTVVHP
jgi:hypothetical protein